MQAYSERYGEKTVAMPSAAAGELRIDMLEPASLDVTITGYAGTNLEGRLRVEAKPLSAKESQKRVYYSRDDHSVGPDGKVTLKPLQPGRYRVDILYSQERWNGSSLDHQDVDVAPGANAVTIAAPAVYSLSVVVAGEADAQLNMQMIGGSGDERWSRAKVGTGRHGDVRGPHRRHVSPHALRREGPAPAEHEGHGSRSRRRDVQGGRRDRARRARRSTATATSRRRASRRAT